MLEKYVVSRLSNKYDLFYWRKRYGQNLAIHASSDLILGNTLDFNCIKISFHEANIVNEATDLNITNLAQYAHNILNKDLVKDTLVPAFPLRLT